MLPYITCSCGVKAALPDDSHTHVVECRRCGRRISLPGWQRLEALRRTTSERVCDLGRWTDSFAGDVLSELPPKPIFNFEDSRIV